MSAFQEDPAKIARDEAELAERKNRLGLEGADAPEVIEVTEDGQIATPTTVAVAEKEPWPHEILADFYGEDWEVRKPTEQALAGFALASGKYVPQKLQTSSACSFATTCPRNPSSACTSGSWIRTIRTSPRLHSAR